MKQYPASKLNLIQNVKDYITLAVLNRSSLIDIDDCQAFKHLEILEFKFRILENINSMDLLPCLENLATLKEFTLELNMFGMNASFEKKLFANLKMPKKINFFKLMFVVPSFSDECDTNPETFQNLDTLSKVLSQIQTISYLAPFIQEFKQLKALNTLVILSFHCSDRLPMLFLLTLGIVNLLESLEYFSFAAHNRVNEFNLTYLLRLLPNPHLLKQLMIMVSNLGFRAVTDMPCLPNL